MPFYISCFNDEDDKMAHCSPLWLTSYNETCKKAIKGSSQVAMMVKRRSNNFLLEHRVQLIGQVGQHGLNVINDNVACISRLRDVSVRSRSQEKRRRQIEGSLVSSHCFFLCSRKETLIKDLEVISYLLKCILFDAEIEVGKDNEPSFSD